MAFKRPNYTKFPNEVLDRIHELSGAEFKLIGVICRQTLGWGRDHSRMSLSFLRKATGLSRQGLLNTIDALINRDWIERIPDKDSFLYGMKFEDDEVVNSVDQGSQLSRPGVVNSVDQGSQLSRPGVVNSVDHQVVNSVDTNKESSFKEPLKNRDKESDRAKNQSEPDPETNPLPVNPQSSNGNTDQPKGIAGDKNSAAAPQSGNDFDLNPEAKQWLCHKAPWHISITDFRDEMLEATYRTSPKYWGLDGGKRNSVAIAHYLRGLERKATVYNGSYQYEQEVIAARASLLAFWESAQRIANERNISPVPVVVPEFDESPDGRAAFEKFKAGLLCKRGT